MVQQISFTAPKSAAALAYNNNCMPVCSALRRWKLCWKIVWGRRGTCLHSFLGLLSFYCFVLFFLLCSSGGPHSSIKQQLWGEGVLPHSPPPPNPRCRGFPGSDNAPRHRGETNEPLADGDCHGNDTDVFRACDGRPINASPVSLPYSDVPDISLCETTENSARMRACLLSKRQPRRCMLSTN